VTPVPNQEERSSPQPQGALEMASVVFLDLVGYSKLGIERQTRLIEELRGVVQKTETYRASKQRGNVLPLPTGDGMALVFFESPLVAVECATEIARILREHPELLMRTGVHTGPVSRTTGINDGINVAGGGINFAQRVMDSGDAGHILVSESVASVLRDIEAWRDHVSDLGNHKVKHGVVIHLFNLTGTDYGNPARPTKLKHTPVAWKAAGLLIVMGALAAGG